MAAFKIPTVNRGQIKRAIVKKVTEVLSRNWQAGLIDIDDIKGYLKMIEGGNFPSKQPLLVEPTEQAIRAFAEHVEGNNVGASKPTGYMGGLAGLNGLFRDVWGGVKDAVSDYVTQPGAERVPLIRISPTITIPEDVIRAEATPAVAKAFGAGLGGSTVPLLIAAGLALMFILKR